MMAPWVHGFGVTVGNAQGFAPLQFGSHLGPQLLTLPLSGRLPASVRASGQ